ncbi:MAG TPA: 4-alpha-glucanotransferase [Aggregatilineales bacterium]|nr:4-alpha-glucanotransferase [Aggregatilineales bacterium]
MLFPRSSGLLLHPTSLPGRYGIGDLGEFAYRFADYLEECGQRLWQVLPLGPTSYGDSPYQSLSAFAGNPLLISVDKLLEAGWLTQADLGDIPKFSLYQVDYGPVIAFHDRMLTLAYQRYTSKATATQKAAFATWKQQNADWLDDFALFATLKDANGGKSWVEWPQGQALREPSVIAEAQKAHAERIGDHCFRQWLFYTQWEALKHYVNSKGIRIVGDIPIFVAHDSSDVWGNRELYILDEQGNPTVVAGVPPDYFSVTGQRWGNPLYRWDVMAKDRYAWWVKRFRAMLSLVDIIRIDHFRGFEAYWEVPASEETAIKGQWLLGPRHQFFDAVRDQLGELPIIAEDLGLMTPGVIELRDSYQLPGMRVLQFAFAETCDDNTHLPHNFVPNCIVYTGTHDNNTTLGWWHEATTQLHRCAETYLGHAIQEPHWELIRLAMMSVAHTAIFPLQDIWGFGADTRMNTPGKLGGNWGWRFTPEWLDNPGKTRLAELTRLYARWPKTEHELAGRAV